MRDYYDDDDRRYNGGRKKKHKGHQGRRQSEGEIWAGMIAEEESSFVEMPKVPRGRVLEETPPQSTGTTRQSSGFVFGPNTRTIKGVQIDMDRVDRIECIENDFKGRTTYGILFVFTGNKGLERKIWFNQNLRERDGVYATEYMFWVRLKRGG